MAKEKTEVSVITMESLELSNPFFIEPEMVTEILEKTGNSVEELLKKLVPIAQQFSRPSISNYNVGVAALGQSGAIYLGVNVEFPGVPLNQAIHAEQFLVANARNHGETGIKIMALSAAPCGHCRQFLSEIGGDIQFYIAETPAQNLSVLLPQAFGPNDLGIERGLMTPQCTDRAFTLDYSLGTLALRATYGSYAPFSGSKSGVAIQTNDGQIYSGSYLETAAFNPSLSPLQVALVSLIVDLRDYSEIKEVLLIEEKSGKISQENVTKNILEIIAPQALFRVEKHDLGSS
jgi:cytidine deaminase